MRSRSLTHVASRIWAVIAAAVTVLSATAVLAQTMPAGQQDMAMMRKMAAADQKLEQLVATMNAAKGEDKVTAIAAVVTELTAQRAAMQEHMRTHCAAMMTSMHPAAAVAKKEPETGAGTEADHAAHHPDK
jgi:hypothetical protein